LRKVALVTGASSGIGLELAKLLAAAGHDLVLVARREPELRSLAMKLEAELGTRTQIVVTDLAQPGAATKLAKSLNDAGIELEILINNAGFGVHGPFVRTDMQTELDMIQVNIVASGSLDEIRSSLGEGEAASTLEEIFMRATEPGDGSTS
jgi:short-subunit dehydrogenase